jgi:hypothetical protein
MFDGRRAHLFDDRALDWVALSQINVTSEGHHIQAGHDCPCLDAFVICYHHKHRAYPQPHPSRRLIPVLIASKTANNISKIRRRSTPQRDKQP